MNKLCIVTLLACLSQISFATDINAYKEGIAFPDAKSSLLSNDRFMKVGKVVSKDSINAIEAGMDKQQVTYLLGNPHFTTGLFGVREWNYVFNFKMIDDSYIVCQYQVRFDDKMFLSASYFSSEACVNESKTNVSFTYITQSSILP